MRIILKYMTAWLTSLVKSFRTKKTPTDTELLSWYANHVSEAWCPFYRNNQWVISRRSLVESGATLPGDMILLPTYRINYEVHSSLRGALTSAMANQSTLAKEWLESWVTTEGPSTTPEAHEH